MTKTKRFSLVMAIGFDFMTRQYSDFRRGFQIAKCLHRLSVKNKKILTAVRYWRKQ